MSRLFLSLTFLVSIISSAQAADQNSINTAARMALKYGAQAMGKVVKVAQEQLPKAGEWAKQHPTETAFIITGAGIGYETSGEGIVDTTFGTASGAMAGALAGGVRIARAAQVAVEAELATAKQTVTVLETEKALLKNHLETANRALNHQGEAIQTLRHVVREGQQAQAKPSAVERAGTYWKLLTAKSSGVAAA